MKTVKYDGTILWASLNHWPKIPNHFLNNLSTFQEDAVQGVGKLTRVAKHNDIEIKNTHYRRWSLLPELNEWIQTNIPCQFNQLGVQISDPVNQKAKLLAHCDNTPRRWTILYILDLGGDNIFTHFYQEKDQPLVRDYRYIVDDYNSLEHIGSIKFEAERWIVVNGLVLHDVDFIDRPRIAITGSVWDLSDLN